MRFLCSRTMRLTLWMMLILPVCAVPVMSQQEAAGAQNVSLDEDLSSLSQTPEGEGPEITPDSHPLTGALRPGIGSWGPRHSFLVPGFSSAQLLESNPLMEAPGVWRGFTSAVAQLQAVQYFGRYIELRYAGAARFDSSATLYGANRITNLHSMSLSSSVTLGSWTLMAHDQAQYSQGSATGDLGMEGLGPVITQLSQWGGVTGIQLQSVALQSGLEPDQTIFLKASRIANSTLVEADRTLSSHSAVTGVAFYNMLHFFTSTAIDGWQEGVLAGYQRTLSPRDRIGLLYGYSRLGFANGPGSLSTSYASLMYGRSISGRLAFEAGAGPETISNENSTQGNNTVDWQGRGDITYNVAGMNFMLLASRMVTGGSGVFYGARTTNVMGGMNKRLPAGYRLSLTAGAARNTSLASTEQYKTKYFGASLSHTGARRFSTFLSYSMENQSGIGCPVSSCMPTGVQQILGAGISWDSRPIGIQ